jgi:hypothetical protein
MVALPVAEILRYPSWAPKGEFHATDHTFDVTVRLTDSASGASGSLLFRGLVSGYVNAVTGTIPYSHATAISSLQLTFGNAITPTLRLGNHYYNVEIPPFSFYNRVDQQWPFDPVSSPSAIQSVPMIVTVSDAPEPTSLALLGGGLSALGLHAWRRRRQGGRG